MRKNLALLKSKNKKRVKAIHAKIKNIRQNMLHQFSHKLVNACSNLVGNVNAKALAQTRLAEVSVRCQLDNTKNLLVKCENAGVWYGEVNETIRPNMFVLWHALAVRKAEQVLE